MIMIFVAMRQWVSVELLKHTVYIFFLTISWSVNYIKCGLVFLSFGNDSTDNRRRHERTRDDVLEHDADVLVAVGAFLLMVEAQSVENLVLDRVVVNAA